MQDVLDRTLGAIRSSQMLRLLTLGFLALVLQIPIATIGGLVRERQERRKEAVVEVSSKWGNRQVITGPALVVPYTHRWTVESEGKATVCTQTRKAIFLPKLLRIRGNIEPETRRRGIFSVPVYKLSLVVEGEFGRLGFSELGIDPAAVDRDHAQLCIGISDVRAIQEQSTVAWNDKRA